MGLLRSLLTISGNTLISRILGFLRDRLVYSVLGLGAMADAFTICVKAPSLFRRLFAEGAFNAAFIPTYTSVYVEQGKEEARVFAERSFTLLAMFLLGLSILAEIYMEEFIWLIAPGFQEKPDSYMYAVEFTRITFPYILFISLTALIGGVLNSMDKFAAPAATQIIANFVVITVFVFTRDTLETAGHAAAWGSLLSGIVQFFWLHWILRRTGIKLWFRRPKVTDSMRKMFKLFIPGVIGSGIVQLNLFVSMMIASNLHTGGVGALSIADRINQLPLSLIGVAMGTALLPLLYRQLKAGEHDAAIDTQNRALELTLLLTLPAAATLMIYADSFLAVLFMADNFTLDHVKHTAPALVAYATGLPAYVVIKVLSASFFAHQDTKTPMYVAGFCFGINAVLSLVSVYTLNDSNLGHVGIAAALSIASWINAVALGIISYYRGFLKLDKQLLRSSTLACVATFACAIVIYYLEPVFYPYFIYSSLPLKISLLTLLVLLGIVSFMLPAYMMGILNIKEIKIRKLKDITK